MEASKTPMNTVSRRTRSQWGIFYRNLYNEVKGVRTRETGGTSAEKQDSGIDGENSSCAEIIEQDEGSGTRDTGVRNRLRSWKKFDMRAKKNDDAAAGKGDDEVIYLGEEVVSNGLSSKLGSESRSGSHSKPSTVDEIVSCSSRRVEKTSLITDQVKNTVVRGRGRPGIKQLNKCRRDDATIILEEAVDSDNSTMKSDGSDASADSWLHGSDSSSKDDASDEDHKEIESLRSDGSHVSHCCSDAEQKEYDDYEVGGEDDLSIKIKADPGEENSSNSIENKKTFIESGNGDGNGNSCSIINSDLKVMEDIIIIDEEDPNVRNSSRVNWKRENKLTRINRLPELRSNYNSMDGTRMPGYSSVSLGSASVNEREDDTVIMTDLKKKKTSGFDGCLDFVKNNKNRHGRTPKHLQSHLIPMAQKSTHEQGKLNCPVIVLESDESASSTDEESESLIKEGSFQIKRSQATKKAVKVTKKKICLRRNTNIIRMLQDSIDALGVSAFPTEESVWTQINLPLKFRFEDEVRPPPKRSESEKEMDSLFGDLEMGLRECEIGHSKSYETASDAIISPEIDKSPAASCQRGEHCHMLDEEIGIRCKYCEIVLLEMKYVLPTFYTPPLGGRDRREFAESRSFIFGQTDLPYPACGIPNHAIRTKGTIWSLMPGIENVLYPHQREGLEFIWKNVAGSIHMTKLKDPLSDGGRGCIISHAPGTGKTRLTIAFLLTFMKLYPTCRPVVVAPCGMLFTWEDELSKWLVDVPFHNMNKQELSDNEYNMASTIFGQVGGGGISLEHVRLAKLYSWMKRKSILGISYRLFEQLAGDNERGRQNEQIRKQLLEYPGVLVLDEGHTARNSKSLMWKALKKVTTQRRIMLTGTPFQNNFTELYNSLCLVNPKFANHFESDETRQTYHKKRGRKSDEARSNFKDFASSICKNTDEELRKLRAMLDPFVHLHKGSILQDSLPGLRNTLVFLHPTELQKTLLEIATREGNIFHRIQLVSLISVHPSLVSETKRFSDYKNELEARILTVDAGVKTKFIMNLVSMADAVGERVLIFSQFLDPLVFIKKQLESHFSWNEGKQVLYMDGKSDVKHRQEKISSFNDHSSKAKVFLASQRACSEGISLVGASRVVLIDTVWNPSVERQAVSRAFRLGQKRVVFVYRLMTSGSEFMQYAQQAEKDRMSQLIFSPVDEDTYRCERSCSVTNDKVLDALVDLDNFRQSFAKIIHQPKESDLIEIFKSVDQSGRFDVLACGSALHLWQGKNVASFYPLQYKGTNSEGFTKHQEGCYAQPGVNLINQEHSSNYEPPESHGESKQRPIYRQDFGMWPAYPDHNTLQQNQLTVFQSQFNPSALDYSFQGRFPRNYGFDHNLQDFQYFVVIDFEATCDKDRNFHPQEIIEFPSVVVNSSSGQLEACFQTYVRPTCNRFLSDFCKDLTGIQQIQVDRGITLSEALLSHDNWLENKGIKNTNFAVVTWSNWDCQVMLESECRSKKIRKPPYFNRWINLRVPFYEVFGGERCSLKEAVEKSGLTWQGRAHCGLDDAKNTARLLALLMNGGFKFSITNSLTEQSIIDPFAWKPAQENPPALHHSQNMRRSQAPPLQKNLYCYCGVTSSRGIIRKPGPKKGSLFFGCGNWTAARGARCLYFEWASP
ncbi:hypothetical protein F511_00204 [Dorcoceras hygrometricum]|nr:hypothetical protein F511_00204 [Dorcoceras hygrometricum]